MTIKQIPKEPTKYKTIAHHTVTPVQVHNRHLSPLINQIIEAS